LPVKAAPGLQRKKVSRTKESTRVEGSRGSVLADDLCTSGPADGRADGAIQPRTAADGDERVLGVEVRTGGEKPTSGPHAGSGALQAIAATDTRRESARLATLHLGDPSRQVQIPNEKSRCSE
jgi:hypothetical protein